MQGSLVSMGPRSMGSISGLFGYPHHHHHHHRVNQEINENHPTAGNVKFVLPAPRHLQHPHPSVTVPHPCVHSLETANLEGPLGTEVCQGPSFRLQPLLLLEKLPYECCSFPEPGLKGPWEKTGSQAAGSGFG